MFRYDFFLFREPLYFFFFLYLSLVIIISIIVCFACCYFMKFSNKTESYTSQLGREMVFFSMKGCGHCEKMKPAWNQLVKNYGSENAYIELHQVVADESPDLIEKYDIQSFPCYSAILPYQCRNKEFLLLEALLHNFLKVSILIVIILLNMIYII